MNSSPSRFARWFLPALRVAMGLVFVYAAWTKLTQPWLQVAMAVDAYELLPAWAVELVARTLPWAELMLGLWLITGKWLRLSTLAASALLSVFMVALVRSFALGMNIDCGCFGSGDPLTLLAVSLLLTFLAFRQRSKSLARDH